MRLVALLLLAAASFCYGETSSALFARGYTVLPTPQKVTLGAKDFGFTANWRLEGEVTARESLNAQLQERFHLTLSGGAEAGLIKLGVTPGAVQIGAAEDSDKNALAAQAYRLDLKPNAITITGNSETGLFYGVQTLVQLLKSNDGKLWLPAGEIEDWPDLELRVIYWDDAHHLEHLEVLKAALRQAAFYKINGFSIKLEGHFQYQHAKPIVEPYALSLVEFQELTDYGLKYHVQVIPYLDGPAHDAFILKHPEYSDMREYPDSNYEFCATNPKTYQLFEGMMDDLLAANKGSKYFVLSTDEPYYVGLADNDQCHEATRAKELGSVGKMLAEFVTKTAGYLHEHGRTVIFWGEYPMKPEDIGSLPPYLVNGELYGPKFDPVFKAHGIRQMVYTSTAGEEQMFPQYYILPNSMRLHPAPGGVGRVQEMFEQASFTSLESLSSTRPDYAHANDADVMGIFVAGWADPGLHPETFWLGYATGPAAAWHRASPGPKELENSFYRIFYGPDAMEMGRLYQLMSEQAQFWEDSWETGPSAARSAIWGNSYGVFNPPKPAHDQFLSPLPVPSTGLLRLDFDWRGANEKRLALAGESLAHSDQLTDLLESNMESVDFNRYNLEVYLSIAGLYRQNLAMIQDLARISDALKAAEMAAGHTDADKAVAALDRALSIAENIRQARNQALDNAKGTWYKSWYPRVAEANGRSFLHEVDNVKDHQPARTVDMSYLVYRELLYPLGDWAAKIAVVRNTYAREHKLAVREFKMDWEDTGGGVTAQRTADDGDN
jgi:hypothetical protein